MPNDLPEYVYKYFKIDEHFFDVFRNQQLWFSSPEDFNDPFDCKLYSPSTVGSNDIDELFNSIFPDQEVQKNFLENHGNSKLSVRFSLFDAFQKLINQRGICCFSEDYENLLMWAHYSNCHKGVCVKFNTSKLKATFNDIFKVIYCERFPEIDLFYHFSETLRSAPFHKSTHWAYEKEVRIQTAKNGLHSFQIEAIEEIIFGVKCKEEIGNVAKVVKSLGYDYIKFRGGQIYNSEYKIYFNRIFNFQW